MATWLVTGGCGFIGSHLVEALLARGDGVRVLDDLSTGTRHPELAAADLVIGDVGDRNLLRRGLAAVDGCFHLAAVASVPRCDSDWHGALHTNVTGSLAVFEAAIEADPGNPIPVVYASSAAVYGENPTVPLSEAAAPAPVSAYGAHKLLCELYARTAWQRHRLPTTGLRFFNVYGPRQDPRSPYSGVISRFVERMSGGAAVEIFGDGRQVRDFVYVSDVVEAMISAMSRLRDTANILNICTGRGTSVLELAGIIAKLLGRSQESRFHPPRTGDIRVSIGDPNLALARLGLRPSTSVEEGLRRLIAVTGPPRS